MLTAAGSIASRQLAEPFGQSRRAPPDKYLVRGFDSFRIPILFSIMNRVDTIQQFVAPIEDRKSLLRLWVSF